MACGGLSAGGGARLWFCGAGCGRWCNLSDWGVWDCFADGERGGSQGGNEKGRDRKDVQIWEGTRPIFSISEIHRGKFNGIGPLNCEFLLTMGPPD